MKEINSKILADIINTYKNLLEEKELKINELKEKIIFSRMITEDICDSEESYELDVYSIDELKQEINETEEEISKIKKTLNHIKTHKDYIVEKEYL